MLHSLSSRGRSAASLSADPSNPQLSRKWEKSNFGGRCGFGMIPLRSERPFSSLSLSRSICSPSWPPFDAAVVPAIAANLHSQNSSMGPLWHHCVSRSVWAIHKELESKHEANSWMWVSEPSGRRGNGINGTFIKKEIRWVNGVCLWPINFSSCGLFTHRLDSLFPGSGWDSRPLEEFLATPLHKLCLSAHFQFRQQDRDFSLAVELEAKGTATRKYHSHHLCYRKIWNYF